MVEPVGVYDTGSYFRAFIGNNTTDRVLTVALSAIGVAGVVFGFYAMGALGVAIGTGSLALGSVFVGAVVVSGLSRFVEARDCRVGEAFVVTPAEAAVGEKEAPSMRVEDEVGAMSEEEGAESTESEEEEERDQRPEALDRIVLGDVEQGTSQTERFVPVRLLGSPGSRRLVLAGITASMTSFRRNGASSITDID